ncbi:uncharacterized protein LOC112202554 [Rosa chinensis]|uniref:uncharacterized protein LOC112202554 n=1 Tax=Rosa chinensis TaxID=74649 RepID=UPI000D08B447|nr:uncharacterized protein LOC112202554 [Rosa chinensis]
MKRPTFELGMEFPNSKVFKSAIRKHAVQTRKEIRFPTNTRHKVLARCKTSPGCPWRIYASTTDLDNPTIFIRTLREGMQNAINKDFEMEVDYQMRYRARVKALKLAQGSHADQYDLLESYAHELKKRNPGTSVWIHTELDGELARFKRIYICIEALKKGWKEGCRPYIGLDGCHLKSVHKGQLLSAVGIDGNNGIYPIAWEIVEAETRETWTWFLEGDLDMVFGIFED